jgi:hypothetical protein
VSTIALVRNGKSEMPLGEVRTKTSVFGGRGSAEYEVTNSASLGAALREPIELTDGEVKVKPELMYPGQAYPFELEGVLLIAVKRSDGSVGIYHLP